MNTLCDDSVKASPVPARLDFAQSVSGLLLALFLWAHIMLVSTILLGKDAMYFVAKMMEASFLSPTGEGYPQLVAGIGLLIFLLFILHAGLAMRKFPANWRQYLELRDQMKMMKHSDTNLWFWQAVT
ncbi:MAG: SdhC, partial [Deltaproteobacteria bacterium]|nr:SdhC [Deltaproteobacteria bacterium]